MKRPDWAEKVAEKMFDPDAGIEKLFVVTVEYEPVFYATEKKAKP